MSKTYIQPTLKQKFAAYCKEIKEEIMFMWVRHLLFVMTMAVILTLFAIYVPYR